MALQGLLEAAAEGGGLEHVKPAAAPVRCSKLGELMELMMVAQGQPALVARPQPYPEPQT